MNLLRLRELRIFSAVWACLETTAGAQMIQEIDLPGSNQTDRRWEPPAMDFRGRVVIFITFGDGSTSQILTPGAAPSGPPPDRD